MQGNTFRCRSCRTLLATASNTITVPHGAEAGDTFLLRRGGGSSNSKGNSADAGQVVGAGSLFVEPLRWMQGLHAVSGKLYCPGCARSLLAYSRIHAMVLLSQYLWPCVADPTTQLEYTARFLCMMPDARSALWNRSFSALVKKRSPLHHVSAV